MPATPRNPHETYLDVTETLVLTVHRLSRKSQPDATKYAYAVQYVIDDHDPLTRDRVHTESTFDYSSPDTARAAAMIEALTLSERARTAHRIKHATPQPATPLLDGSGPDGLYVLEDYIGARRFRVYDANAYGNAAIERAGCHADSTAALAALDEERRRRQQDTTNPETATEPRR